MKKKKNGHNTFDNNLFKRHPHKGVTIPPPLWLMTFVVTRQNCNSDRNMLRKITASIVTVHDEIAAAILIWFVTPPMNPIYTSGLDFVAISNEPQATPPGDVNIHILNSSATSPHGGKSNGALMSMDADPTD